MKSNLKLVLLNNGFWAGYHALTYAFVIAFALVLGANNTWIGILGAIPYCTLILSQIPGEKLVERFKRKIIYLICNTIARSSWLLILIIPLLFMKSPVYALAGILAFITFFDYISEPAIVSLVGDLVPKRIRGRFFGKKLMINGIVGTSLFVIGGIFLDVFPKDSLNGFLILMSAGVVMGLLSNFMVKKIKEPAYKDHKYHKLKEFFRYQGDFKKFCIFVFFFNFAFMIASPFFAVYMLENLELSYTFFVLAGAIAAVTRFIAHKHLGRLADIIGDKPIAQVCTFGTALLPFFYLFITKETVWLIVPVQLISGFVWGGVDLSIYNLLLDLTQPKLRALQTAKYSMLTSIPLIIAPVIGGYVADNITFILTGIPLIFAVSFVLRALAALLLVRLKEPRIKGHYPIAEVIREMLVLHSVHGMQQTSKMLMDKKRNNKLYK